MGLLLFAVVACLVIANGFDGLIFAQRGGDDVYQSISPIGEVLSEIQTNWVDDPDFDEVVEGALTGMMKRLDSHSSYIPPRYYKELSDDTKGQFEGIGVSIHLNTENQSIVIVQPLEGSPALKAGIAPGDIIVEIDGLSTEGFSLSEAANRIKGPKGTVVRLKIYRTGEEGKRPELLDIDVTRGRIKTESIRESRLFPNKVGYIRLGDFKQTSADDMREAVTDLLDQGMRAFVLDLRWNPGGLLNASSEVSALFLPRRTLVTYTKGRQGPAQNGEDMIFRTQRAPVLPDDFPMAVLVSRHSASAAEIVTGALQFHKRALIVGQTTYGKGSVQTIIPLKYPEGSAIRLTTALYYTPAEVTINKRGIKPDIETALRDIPLQNLLKQMSTSYLNDPSKKNEQNHGIVVTTSTTEGEETEIFTDSTLVRAFDLLDEDPVFNNLIEKYHKDPHETQVAAITADGETADQDEAATASN
jgi:carboxyl-terminal processing protease